jgi:hypothetical protein
MTHGYNGEELLMVIVNISKKPRVPATVQYYILFRGHLMQCTRWICLYCICTVYTIVYTVHIYRISMCMYTEMGTSGLVR